MKNKRKLIWIDRFQTHLIVRVAFYCLIFQVATWLLVIIGLRLQAVLEGMLGPAGPDSFLFLAVVMVLLLTVMFVFDAVRLAHRVVGPLVRFRKAIRAITAGEEVELLRLRDGDYLLEMKDEFNAMLQALEQRGAITLKATEAQQKQNEPAAV